MLRHEFASERLLKDRTSHRRGPPLRPLDRGAKRVDGRKPELDFQHDPLLRESRRYRDRHRPQVPDVHTLYGHATGDLVEVVLRAVGLEISGEELRANGRKW